jgi:hypothetical protein
MTSPSSSTSNFEPTLSEAELGSAAAAGFDPVSSRVLWRYLATLLLVAASLVSAAWALITTERAKHQPAIPYQVLFTHQAKKIELPTPDTVFLGDSSLGNAISAAHWQELSQRSALNLALTGSYGYAGSYNFLRRILQRGHPRNVVIVQTADMPTRNTSARAFELTKPEAGAFQRLSERWAETMNFTQLRAALTSRWSSGAEQGPAPPSEEEANPIVNDYIKQLAPVPPARQKKTLDPRRISRSKMEYLYQIVALCEKEQLNCVYAYGPLSQLTCQMSSRYFGPASQAIRASGIRLAADRPFCMEPEAMGDSVDHVRPERKASMTERYYELLKPFLR